MVGNHAIRRAVLRGRTAADRVRDGLDEGTEQIGVVVRVHALENRRDTFQPHTGVDRRARQRIAVTRRDLLVLHEDQVPELEEAVAIFVRRARRPALQSRALIDEDFRTWAARACVAHLPEIVRGADTDDAVVGEAGDLLPQAVRFVVIGVDGDQKLILRQRKFLGDQVPGQLDGAFLEVIAEGEVAEHLEEGVMPRGVADIVEVVVLAAGAHAFLRRRGAHVGPLLDAGEDVLELHHAGIGEHQGRVVARHQFRRRNGRMIVAHEIIEKALTDVVDAAHRNAA